MSTLYIVPTPIGNLGDITMRAVEVLKNIHVILCEDTRVTRKLLRLLEIDYKKKKLLMYFEYNERKKLPNVIEMLKGGTDIALVSDAGTPLLSDPGFPLVREIRRNKDLSDIKIEILPGATSIITALITSGLPTDKFTFLGYFPRKPNDRKKLFKAVRKSSQYIKTTYVAFEVVNRLEVSLKMMRSILGKNVQVVLCRELTKKFENVTVYKIDEVLNDLHEKKVSLKGEVVVVFNLGVLWTPKRGRK